MSDPRPLPHRAATAAVEDATQRTAPDPVAEERRLWDAAVLTMLERGVAAKLVGGLATEIVQERREVFGDPSA